MANDVSGWEVAYRNRPTSGREIPHEDAESIHLLFQKYQVQRILDLGCGDGRHLFYFGKLGYEMCGLDYAPTAISLAEEWLLKEGLSAELVCTDMSTIPWSNDFFDAVICIQVINHHCIEGIRRTIKEIHRILRPEGWLFLTVGTSRPSNTIADRKGVKVEPNTYVWLEGHEKGVPHHFFSMEELLKEFSQFDIVDLHQDRRNKTCMFARKPHSTRMGRRRSRL